MDGKNPYRALPELRIARPVGHSLIFLSSTVASTLVISACGGSGESGSGTGTNDVPIPSADGAAALVDPAPELSEPGEYRCEDCPDSGAAEFNMTVDASATQFEGVVEDAVGDGEFYVVADDGSSTAGTIPTAVNGAFAFDLPLFCGVQVIKCVWSNASGRYVLLTEVTRENCTSADIQITLDWDELGEDFELHLVKPGGQLNDDASDCTWTSCVNQQPDWGVQGEASDDPLKDVDDTGNFGPENIFLSTPESGTYRVLVEHWGGGPAEADGRVVFNVAGQTTVVETSDLASHHVWNVGSIDWPSGEVVLDGSTFDCNDNWAGGCQAELGPVTN